ncbi:MAG: type II toxin-antitoxin system HicB family antitoxin [Campylobacterota bacterium]|nr:type II toxin-antitoxin system HicB family antitoxin [Campylobacterota bacterium]
MSNTIEYKDYIGSVEYSNEDRCFFGKIEMIDDLVTFEAISVDELEVNFQNCVDEYIKTCKQLQREPQKAYKGVFNVRIEPKLHKQIYKEALKTGISLNAFINNILNNSVDKNKAFIA